MKEKFCTKRLKALLVINISVHNIAILIPMNLLEAISDLFEGKAPTNLPSGVEKVERVTPESVRIKFFDEVDDGLLSRIADEEGYIVRAKGFTPRIIEKGTIVVRVGSRSDPGRRCDVYLYLFPPEKSQMSTYRRIVAQREGVLNPETGEINLEKLYGYNLRIIKLIERYRRERYRNITTRLEL